MIAALLPLADGSIIPTSDYGPFAGVMAFLAGATYLTREWRMGRQIRVDVAEERAKAAEGRADKAETERDVDINRLKDEINGLRSEIAGLRDDITAQRRHYEVQMEAVHRESERKTAEIFRLREWILSGRAVTGELPPPQA